MALQNRRILKISSKDRLDQKQTTTDFTVDCSNYGLQNAASISTKHVQFINFEYNINKNTNTLVFQAGGIGVANFSLTSPLRVVVEVTPGQYTAAELIDYLNLDVDIIAAGITFSLDSANKINLTTTGTFAFQTTYEDPNNSLVEILGLCTGSPSFTGGVTADCPPQLQGLETVILHSSAIGNRHMIESRKNTNNNGFSVIPVNSVYGASVNYNSPEIEADRVVFKTKTDITSIDIQVKNPENQIINLHGGHILIVLEVYF